MLFLHLIPAHMFSALRIEEIELENLCSNLLPVEVDRHSLLFLLICLSLVFQMKFCNVFSLEPVSPGCDGSPFASPPFRRMEVEALFSAVSLFGGGLDIALSLIRSVSVQVIEACPEENLLDKCSRQCGNTTDLFFTAQWLQQSRSFLMQEIQLARNIDMTCYKALMSEPATCSQVVPTSRNGQWTPIAGSDSI